MGSSAKRLLNDALQLPEKDRGELAARLLESLDDVTEDPAEVRRAWELELERRVREVQDGTAELVDGDEFLHELRAWRPADR